MDNACKTYYMGVKSGAISKENFTPTLSGDVHIIATGGMANTIVPHCTHQIIKDEFLLFKGLFNATHQE